MCVRICCLRLFTNVTFVRYYSSEFFLVLLLSSFLINFFFVFGERRNLAAADFLSFQNALVGLRSYEWTADCSHAPLFHKFLPQQCLVERCLAPQWIAFLVGVFWDIDSDVSLEYTFITLLTVLSILNVRSPPAFSCLDASHFKFSSFPSC